MFAKNARILGATSCLVTLLHMPAGALTFGVLPTVTPDRREASPGASQVDPAFWFRTDFVLLAPGAAGPVVPADPELWTGPEPAAPPAPPAVQVPLTVQNLRRSEQR